MNANIRRSFATFFAGVRSARAARNETATTKRQQLTHFFKRFRQDVPALRQRQLEDELINAPHFNIFRVLPIERRETILHSPLLAHLLDPTASHGQGCLFLNAFFETAARNCDLTVPTGPLNSKEWTVRSEVYIGNGTIDLLLECPARRYVLVIENKIDALEQPAQLSRYHRWLRERRSNFQHELVYLTPSGRPSEQNPRTPCTLLSYDPDIIEILESAKPKILPLHLKIAINQYLAVLYDWRNENNEQS